MKFVLKLDCNNDAFAPPMCGPETARILRELEERVTSGDQEGVLHDVNGNRVGEWAFRAGRVLGVR
jgi:hypothetical protein